MNKELSDNNKKINAMQFKIDDLVLDIKKHEELLSFENYDYKNTTEFNEGIERRLFTNKEALKIREGKLIAIKQEIDNVKEYIDEGDSERELLNKKLEELCQIVLKINQQNSMLNIHLNFIIESFNKKVNFLTQERSTLSTISDMKNKILTQVKEIDSYKNIVDNF